MGQFVLDAPFHLDTVPEAPIILPNGVPDDLEDGTIWLVIGTRLDVPWRKANAVEMDEPIRDELVFIVLPERVRDQTPTSYAMTLEDVRNPVPDCIQGFTTVREGNHHMDLAHRRAIDKTGTRPEAIGGLTSLFGCPFLVTVWTLTHQTGARGIEGGAAGPAVSFNLLSAVRPGRSMTGEHGNGTVSSEFRLVASGTFR